ncbi:unnamed protein product [Lactuca virosa]|uniref:Uncharacterized protein n=1 Tax=Lactuca virosa TaxID=75947 RepID=A0AAU9PQ53_9ASTR|nr:unnamed protein product [Lactuca virosa]
MSGLYPPSHHRQQKLHPKRHRPAASSRNQTMTGRSQQLQNEPFVGPHRRPHMIATLITVSLNVDPIDIRRWRNCVSDVHLWVTNSKGKPPRFSQIANQKLQSASMLSLIITKQSHIASISCVDPTAPCRWPNCNAVTPYLWQFRKKKEKKK